MCEQQARDNHAQDGDLWNQCFIVGIDSKPCDGLKAKGHKCGQYQLALDELGNGFARKDEAERKDEIRGALEKEAHGESHRARLEHKKEHEQNRTTNTKPADNSPKVSRIARAEK